MYQFVLLIRFKVISNALTRIPLGLSPIRLDMAVGAPDMTDMTDMTFQQLEPTIGRISGTGATPRATTPPTILGIASRGHHQFSA